MSGAIPPLPIHLYGVVLSLKKAQDVIFLLFTERTNREAETSDLLA
jgi:hypothetical protein